MEEVSFMIIQFHSSSKSLKQIHIYSSWKHLVLYIGGRISIRASSWKSLTYVPGRRKGRAPPAGLLRGTELISFAFVCRAKETSSSSHTKEGAAGKVVPAGLGTGGRHEGYGMHGVLRAPGLEKVKVCKGEDRS